MDEDAVTLDDAARGERGRQRRRKTIDLAPAPGSAVPDKACAVAVPARILRQEMREIHHPARHPRQAAARRSRGGPAAHRRPIHTPAATVRTSFIAVPS
jgi:hypothetical protein